MINLFYVGKRRKERNLFKKIGPEVNTGAAAGF
jgi:hypothetical protein